MESISRGWADFWTAAFYLRKPGMAVETSTNKSDSLWSRSASVASVLMFAFVLTSAGITSYLSNQARIVKLEDSATNEQTEWGKQWARNSDYDGVKTRAIAELATLREQVVNANENTKRIEHAVESGNSQVNSRLDGIVARLDGKK